MVKLYKFIGYIGIFGGIIDLFLIFAFWGAANAYTIAGGIAAIIYGIIAFIKASYFERLEAATEEARANTKLLLKYITNMSNKLETETGKIQAYTNAIYNQLNKKTTPTAPDPLTPWKPQE